MGTESNYNAAPRFRQRKISLKQQLRILWQRDLPSNIEDVRGDLLGIVETGVDKNEEDERHLQAVLNSANISGKSSGAFIPTPKASVKWNEYSNFYHPGWSETESYIRSSATVEDAQGNEYNMDEEDVVHLSEINSKITDAKAKCTEDEYEMVCTLIEAVVAEKQPFLSIQPDQLFGYKELEKHIFEKLEARKKAAANPLDLERMLAEAQSPDYANKLVGSPNRSLTASVKTFGSAIYQHWRKRKLARGGKSIFPSLKYESGLASDDSDPYVCFRHREVRQSRKTRRTDQQNSGRIRKLHTEMQDAQSIFNLILSRERKRLQQIQTDFEVFELRCRVKALKRKLKIGPEPDDIGLLVSVPKRVRQEEEARKRREESERQKRAQLAREKLEREKEKKEASRESHRESSKEPRSSAGAASLAAAEARKTAAAMANGSRIPDLDHITVESQLADRDAALEQAVAEKLRQRKEADEGWVNATGNPYVPYVDFFNPTLMSPPNSSDSDSFRADDLMDIDNLAANTKPESDYENLDMGTHGYARSSDSQLMLPLSYPDNSDSAEVIELQHSDSATDGTESGSPQLSRYSDIDFFRNPNRFSVPRDAPQAFCRKRTFGNITYIDRIIPPKSNPLAKFGDKLMRSSNDEDARLVDRYRFDHEYMDTSDNIEDLCNDPSKLNGISFETQNLRFSSMLTAKACELLADAQAQRRRAIQAMIKRQQQQQQQRAAAEAQAQQNAQLQAQTNLRLQQGQRALQRQQQRKKPNGEAGQIPSGSGKGKGSPASAKLASPGGGDSNHAANSVRDSQSSALPTKASTPGGLQNGATHSPAGLKPSQGSEPKASLSEDKKKSDEVRPNGKGVGKGKGANVGGKGAGQGPSSRANGNGAGLDDSRLAPQLPKLEASG